MEHASVRRCLMIPLVSTANLKAERDLEPMFLPSSALMRSSSPLTKALDVLGWAVFDACEVQVVHMPIATWAFSLANMLASTLAIARQTSKSEASRLFPKIDQRLQHEL